MELTKLILVCIIFASLIQNEVCQGNDTLDDADDDQLNNQEHEERPQPQNLPPESFVKGYNKDVTTETPNFTRFSKRPYRRPSSHYMVFRPISSTKYPKFTWNGGYKRNYTGASSYDSKATGQVYKWNSPETQMMNSALGKYMQYYQQQQQHYQQQYQQQPYHQMQKPMSWGPVEMQDEGSACFVSSQCKTGCCVYDSKNKDRTCRNMSRLYEPCNDAQVKGGAYSDHCPCEIKEGTSLSCEKNVCQISRGNEDYTF